MLGEAADLIKPVLALLVGEVAAIVEAAFSNGANPNEMQGALLEGTCRGTPMYEPIPPRGAIHGGENAGAAALEQALGHFARPVFKRPVRNEDPVHETFRLALWVLRAKQSESASIGMQEGLSLGWAKLSIAEESTHRNGSDLFVK